MSSIQIATKKEVTTDEKRQKRNKLIRGCIITFIGAGCWGANGTLVKYMLDYYALSPEWLVCVRELGACWLFLLTAYFTNKQGLVAAAKNPKALFKIFLVGIVGILLSNLSYVKSIEATNSATATIMQSISVLMVLLYVCLRNKRLPRGRETLGVILALVGTYLLATGGKPGQLELPVSGLFWGFGTAITAAAFVILPTRLLKSYGSFVVNGFAMLAVGLAFSLIVHPWDLMPNLDAAGWGMVVVTILLGTYGAYALYLYGLKEVGSMRAALLGNAEPLLAILTSVVFLGTSFSLAEFAGFTMIIVMVFLTA